MRVANPAQAQAVASAIDAEFSNSASETRTQTESAFAAGFIQQMGNIQFLLLAIGGIVFFTLLLVTGNTMAIAVRERTGELAVLKAIGFSERFVLAIVLVESLVIAAIGGALGLWLARWVTNQDITSGLLLLYLPPIALGVGLAFALGTGLLAGLLPAVGAMRLNVAAALRRVTGQPAVRSLQPVMWRPMAIPLVYNIRSAMHRWTSSLVAIVGIAGRWPCSSRCSRSRAGSRRRSPRRVSP